MVMAKLFISCLPLMIIIMHSFALAGLPCLAVAADAHLFSFQLHLHHHPSAHDLTAASSSSRSTPLFSMLFSEPLTLNPPTTTTTPPPHPSASADNNTIGSASGLYIYDATSAELRYFFFTATLGLPRSAQSGISSHCSAAAAAICSGSLMLIGNVDSGAVAVVGGTHDFANASGQASVTILPRSSDPAAQLLSLAILFDVEVQYPSSIALH